MMMARGFGAGANQVVKADTSKSQDPGKKVIQGSDLRTGNKK